MITTVYVYACMIVEDDGVLLLQSPDDYLSDNEARVRDVEIVTGLEFFTGLAFDSAIRTRTYLPRGVW